MKKFLWKLPDKKFKEFQKKFFEKISFETVTGGYVPVFDVYGKERSHSIVAQKIPTLDARGREILFFSDLHFFIKNPKVVSPRKLQKIIRILSTHPKAIIILGGDIYESARIDFETLRTFIALGKEKKAKKFHRLFADLHNLFRTRDTILLPGNHDPLFWYESDSFALEISKFFGKRIRIKTLKETILFQHGNQLFKNYDEAKWNAIYEVPLFMRRSFSAVENFSLNILGEQMLRKLRPKINARYKLSVPKVKEAFDVDRVIMGHSHIQEQEDSLGLSVNGLGQHGRIEYIFINQKGDVFLKKDWYVQSAHGIQSVRNIFWKISKKFIRPKKI